MMSMEVDQDNSVDELEEFAIRVLEKPDLFMQRFPLVADRTRIFRLWRYPTFDSLQSWHVYV
jgi:hypothetical protein